jgi:solute:Na+ symporter, SSS family
MNGYLAVLIGYGAALILLGLFLASRVRDPLSFFVADRRLSPGLLFSTLLAANIGAGSTVGAAGLGYALGLSGWWWVGSAGIGSLILAFSVGPRLRDLAARFDFLTLGDFLEHRYGAAVRALTSVLLWFGTLFILAGQLIAFAWILRVVAGTDKTTGCLLGGLVVVTYFAAGGLKGAAWINLVQLVVKSAGFLISVPLVLAGAGGWSGLKQSALPAEFFSIVGIGWAGVLSFLILLVPSFIVSPGLIQKIYGSRDAGTVRRAAGANGLALLLFAALPVLLGMAAAARRPGLSSQELALPTVIVEMLPFWLGALLLAAVFSAEISSADAILFMLSTSLTKDLYKRFINPRIDDRGLLRVSRLTAVLSGAAGIACALLLESVIAALSVFYGLLSVALLAPVTIGLYRTRPGGRACLVAIGVSVSAAGAFHLATDGAGLGPLSTTGFGILLSATLLGVASIGRRADRTRAA